MRRRPHLHPMVACNDNGMVSDPEMDRLRAALAGVVGALNRQAQAVSRLQDQCQALENAVQGCGSGLGRLRDSLHDLRHRATQQRSPTAGPREEPPA